LLLSRVRSEGGFTLIELVIGLTILAVGIGAVVNVFHSAFAVAGQGNNRSRAVALATREAEAMRAVPYERLGFAADQAGFVADFEGLATVVVTDPLVAPVETGVEVGGISFSFVRHVVWADAASVSGFADAYKRATALVSWTDEAGVHEVRQDAFVYPGGQGEYVGPQGGAASTTTTLAAIVPPSAPLTLSASVPSGTEGSTSVDLSWTASPISVTPIDTWIVEYSTDSFLSSQRLTDTQPASNTALTASGLSPATTYGFRVASQSSNGLVSTWSVTALATTTPALSNACELGTATLTPSALKRQHGVSTMLSGNVTAVVNTTGTCSGLQLRYSPIAGIATTAFLMAGSGGMWSGTLNGITTSWDTGTHSVEVLDGVGTVLGTMTVTVCVHNARSCP
jgi:prepilin-type N-terminal cleavage/methylation domain-containing protein